MEPRVLRPGEHGSMNVKTTLLGLTLLAVLAAGAWWARSPSPTAVTAPASKGASANSADDEGLPDASAADVSAADGDVRVYLSLRPKPPVALAKFRARVGVAREMAPPPADAVGSILTTALELQDARISFEMEMPMGDHRYTLVPGSDGWLEAAVVLPT
jgi:hypothetical protein